MGCGRWTSDDWKRYSSARISGRNVSEIYSSKNMKPEYNPYGVKVRESRDSIEHTHSTPIIIGLDVTGSMSRILEVTANCLGDMVKEILDRQPVSDPQIMFAAIGDAMCDRAPLQVTQFESDIRIASQLTDLWFERGGGGNNFESYPLIWYFAANHTSTDSWEKRQKKGFIFTMGDDCFPEKLTQREIKQVFNDDIYEDISVEALYSQVSRKYDVFHLLLEQGGSASRMKPEKWRNLMGERAISVSDYNCIPQIIVSIMESVGGRDTEEIIKSWDKSTQLAVRNAIGGLAKKSDNKGFFGKFIKF
ncbi:MAG: hypothetical protein ACI4JM_09855 [Oscillospiraceae bacterium]